MVLPIAEVLEECRQRMARGETIESCLAAYPAHADELSRLLPIAVRLRSLARDPDVAYVDAARRRFAAHLAAARARRPATSRAPLAWLKRLAVPVAIVLVLFLSGFGLVQASDTTLPDSPLYSVKEAQDTVARALARSPEARAATELRIGRQRLAELLLAERLGKNPALLRRLAVGMVQATNTATVQIEQTPPSRRRALLTSARTLMAQEARVLERFTRARNPQVEREASQLLDQIHADQNALAD
jgi:hypothetical protein